MKTLTPVLLIGLASFPWGCGGGGPDSSSPPPLTAAEVVTNRPETWTFQNGYGDTTSIEVRPQPDGTTVWHYTKSNARAYWAPAVEDAELYFRLERMPEGSWYCSGMHIIFPSGCAGCPGPVDLDFTLIPNPGVPRPYLIVPARSGASPVSMQTTVYETYDPNALWRTDSYTEWVDTPIYAGWAMVSEQWEGPCVHEKWWFAPGLGMVKVAPLASGDYPDECRGLDPQLTMVRVQ